MDLSGARWRKSSASGENGNSQGCVEAAFLTSGDVAPRDSKDRSRTPHVVSQPAWESFVAGIRAGEFTRSVR
jgi:hypothetical protein